MVLDAAPAPVRPDQARQLRRARGDPGAVGLDTGVLAKMPGNTGKKMVPSIGGVTSMFMVPCGTMKLEPLAVGLLEHVVPHHRRARGSYRLVGPNSSEVLTEYGLGYRLAV